MLLHACSNSFGVGFITSMSCLSTWLVLILSLVLNTLLCLLVETSTLGPFLPDRNNKVIRSKTQTRRELLSPLRSHDSCPDRHTRCKISPVPRDAEFSPQHSHDKHMMESKIYSLVKGRPTPAVEKRPKKTDNKPRFS